MRIAILASGTRGDTQPMLALGEELKLRGHSVAMTVNKNLAAWARRSTLDIVVLPVDSEETLKSPEGIELLAKGDAIRLNREMSRRDMEANLQSLAAYCDACRGADLVLSTALTLFRGDTFAEYFQVPHATIATMPWLRTGEYPMLLSPVRSLGSQRLHRASYDLYHSLWWQSSRKGIAEARRALGLPRSPGRPCIDRLPTVGIYSPLLSPRPREWRSDQPITGFITPTPELRARLGEGALPDGLDAWLDAGPAPVYFGFGSMPIRDPRSMLEMVANVTRAKGVRALIGAGWSEFAPATDSLQHVFIAPAFDHERVLPRCRAAVHHGGAGTTGAVLRAGLPALIASVFADQPYWAWRLANLGVGIASRFRDLSQGALDLALDRLLMEDMQLAAREVGVKLRAERGAERAADVIDGWCGVRNSNAAQSQRSLAVTRARRKAQSATWGRRSSRPELEKKSLEVEASGIG